MKRDTEEKPVYFHPKQIEYLEKQFPERVLPSTTPEATLREYFGTRMVIHFLRSKMNSDAA